MSTLFESFFIILCLFSFVKIQFVSSSFISHILQSFSCFCFPNSPFHPKFLFPKEKHKISFVIFSKKSSDIFLFPVKGWLFIRLRNGQSRSLQHFFSMWLMIQCLIVLFIRGWISKFYFRQHRTIPAWRLKHRSGGCGTASALSKCSIIHKVLSALLA